MYRPPSRFGSAPAGFDSRPLFDSDPFSTRPQPPLSQDRCAPGTGFISGYSRQLPVGRGASRSSPTPSPGFTSGYVGQRVFSTGSDAGSDISATATRRPAFPGGQRGGLLGGALSEEEQLAAKMKELAALREQLEREETAAEKLRSQVEPPDPKEVAAKLGANQAVPAAARAAPLVPPAVVPSVNEAQAKIDELLALRAELHREEVAAAQIQGVLWAKQHSKLQSPGQPPAAAAAPPAAAAPTTQFTSPPQWPPAPSAVPERSAEVAKPEPRRTSRTPSEQYLQDRLESFEVDRPQGVEWLVDDSELKLKTGHDAVGHGLAYRFSKNLDDMDMRRGGLGGPAWDTKVTGIDEGDGWVRVPDGRYLPTELMGARVLRPPHMPAATRPLESPAKRRSQQIIASRAAAAAAGGPAASQVRMLITALDHKNGDNVQALAKACDVRDMTVMYFEQSTKEALLDQIARIGRRCQAGDVFVFYFAGHGATWKDGEGDDDQGQIAKESSLIDDEFAEAVTSAVPPDASVVIITDSYHTGTIADLEHEMWNGRKAVSITINLDERDDADIGRCGMLTHSMLMAIDALGEEDKPTYSVARLYKETVTKLRETFQKIEQAFWMQTTTSASPYEIAWPLIPRRPYKAPLNSAVAHVHKVGGDTKVDLPAAIRAIQAENAELLGHLGISPETAGYLAMIEDDEEEAVVEVEFSEPVMLEGVGTHSVGDGSESIAKVQQELEELYHELHKRIAA